MIQDMMPLFSVFLSCGYSSWGGPSHCDARSRTASTKKNFAVREAEAGDSRKTPRDHSSCTILSGTLEQLSIFCSSGLVKHPKVCTELVGGRAHAYSPTFGIRGLRNTAKHSRRIMRGGSYSDTQAANP